MSYTIQVHPSGHRFDCHDGETVLDAALRQGVGLPYGCRNGSCASCRGKLLSGEVGYAGGLPEGLTAEDQRSGLALFCQALPFSDLVIEAREVHAAADIAPRIIPCKVMRKMLLCHDVMGLYLKLPEAERLQFLAGQYIDIIQRDGQRRAFSIANAPHDDSLIELHVRLVEGGEFTHYIFEQMPEKSLLRFEGPLGSFFLREASPRPILMMGGGTGFAPLKGMVEHALHIGITRPIHLYWGAREERDLYMADLPRRWAAEHPHIRFTPVLSHAAPDSGWRGRTGYVHEALAQDYPDLGGYDVYMSGPPVMIQAACAVFEKQGLPHGQMYSDAFEFAPHPPKAAAGS